MKKALISVLLFAFPSIWAFSLNLDALEDIAARSGEPTESYEAPKQNDDGFRLGVGIGAYVTWEGKNIFHFGGMPSMSVKAGSFKDVLSFGVGAELASVAGSGDQDKKHLVFEMKLRNEILFRIDKACRENRYSDTYIGIAGEYKLLSRSSDPTIYSVCLCVRSEYEYNPLYFTGDVGLAGFRDGSVCFVGALGVGVGF